MTRTKKTLIFILIAGLILRLAVLLYFWDRPLKIVDETHYQAIAENILLNNEFSLKTGRPTSIRPPLYPAFLASIYYLTGAVNMNVVRIIQIIMGLATVIMVYLLGRKIFNEKAALPAAFIFAVYPSFLFFSNLLLTEVFFTFLFIMFVWFFLQFMERRKTGDIVLAGLFLGLGALTRSIMYPFIAVAIIFLLFASEGTVTRKVKWLVVFFVGYAVVIGPWAVRNTMLHGDFVAVGTMGGLNIYMGNYEHTPLDRSWSAVDLEGKKAWHYGHKDTLKGMNEAEKQKWAVKKAREFIMNNKMLTLKRDLVKAANLWGIERTLIGGIINGYYPEFRKKGYLAGITLIIFISYALVSIGAIFGITYNFSAGKYHVVFITLLAAYFTGLHAIVFGHPRYHLPLVALLVIFAAWTLKNAGYIWGSRSTKEFRLSVVLTVILVGSWVREVVFVEAARYLDKF